MTTALTSDEMRLSRAATEAPRIPFDEFKATMFDWQRGEHIGFIGPTGQGKTTLMKTILPTHPYTTVFVTKPRDDSLEPLIYDGYHRMERWQSIDPRIHPRRLLWPDATRLGAVPKQSQVFGDAMDRIYREGKWTVAIDELMYVTNRLKLRSYVQDYYTQGRSIKLSIVAATQKPAWVPGEMYDQSTHLFMWRNNDGRAQQRLGEINLVDSALVRDVVSRLEQFQVLYINTRTGLMCRTRVPRPRMEVPR